MSIRRANASSISLRAKPRRSKVQFNTRANDVARYFSVSKTSSAQVAACSEATFGREHEQNFVRVVQAR